MAKIVKVFGVYIVGGLFAYAVATATAKEVSSAFDKMAERIESASAQ